MLPADLFFTRKLTMTLTRLAVTILILSFIPVASNAEPTTFFDFIDEKPSSELWLNPGLNSYHFQTDRNLNNNNYGFGAEYRYSSISSVNAGRFYNSEYETSTYATWFWQPVKLGPVRFGTMLGFINGYPRVDKGNRFPILLPVVSYEYKFIGVNLTYVPTIQDTLYGALSLQLKLRVY